MLHFLKLIYSFFEESLATIAYTFESEYQMTGYDVTPFPLGGGCESWHGWTRVFAGTNTHMAKDHTLHDGRGKSKHF